MKKSLIILEVFVGLLTLIATVITLYPFKFGMGFGGEILAFGIMISAVTLLIAGALRLANVLSYGSLSSAQKISGVTSVITIASAVIILYFQMVSAVTGWLSLLFGLGLLSYAGGRVVTGAVAGEHNFGLRVFNSAMGAAVGALSIIVIFFPLVRISSAANTSVYLPYGYFVRIALILIGINFLISGILSTLLNGPKQSPISEAANPSIPE